MVRNTELQNVTIRLPEDLIKEMDGKIDGIKYRNRTHFIIVAITEFLNKEK